MPQALARYAGIVPDPGQFEAAMARPPPLTLWAHPERVTRGQLQRLLAAGALESDAVSWDPLLLRLPPGAPAAHHWGYFAGLFQIQEEAARLPVTWLDPQPGERILDLCAAPGNKTAQIALAMRNTGTVVANELQTGRLSAMRQLIRRLGLVNVVTLRGAGESLPLHTGPFDRVLVDAPCSGEGTWRRHPPRQEVGRRGIPAEAREQLVRRQLRLLERALRVCRPGGRVVYATCTFAPEENEGVINALLQRAEGAVEIEPPPPGGPRTSPGITAWDGESYDARVAHCRRIWPGQTETGGFFVAVLRRLDTAEGGIPQPAQRDLIEDAQAFPGHPATRVIQSRFGLEDDALRGLVTGRDRGRYLHYCSAGLHWPAHPIPDARGLAVVGLQVKPFKPTTAFALWRGRMATRNRAELDAEAAEVFLQRGRLPVSAAMAETPMDGVGWVIITHAGHPLGVARRTGAGMLESQFPKAWMRARGGGG